MVLTLPETHQKVTNSVILVNLHLKDRETQFDIFCKNIFKKIIKINYYKKSEKKNSFERQK